MIIIIIIIQITNTVQTRTPADLAHSNRQLLGQDYQ